MQLGQPVGVGIGRLRGVYRQADSTSFSHHQSASADRLLLNQGDNLGDLPVATQVFNDGAVASISFRQRAKGGGETVDSLVHTHKLIVFTKIAQLLSFFPGVPQVNAELLKRLDRIVSLNAGENRAQTGGDGFSGFPGRLANGCEKGIQFVQVAASRLECTASTTDGFNQVTGFDGESTGNGVH